MAEKEAQHLRVRLGADLLELIDEARGSRTRTDEIERRLEASFLRTDMEMVAELAVHSVLTKVQDLLGEQASAAGVPTRDIYDDLYDYERRKVRERQRQRTSAYDKLMGKKPNEGDK